MNEFLTVQNTLSACLFVIMSFAGNWLRHLQKNLDELSNKNKAQDKQLQEIKLEIERDFTRKAEFERFVEKIFQKLEKISEKLDEKADK